jgi:hypothetical protein
VLCQNLSREFPLSVFQVGQITDFSHYVSQCKERLSEILESVVENIEIRAGVPTGSLETLNAVSVDLAHYVKDKQVRIDQQPRATANAGPLLGWEH